MADIHSAAAEIRRGKKKKEERRRRTNHSMKIYMVSLFHRATIKNYKYKHVLANILCSHYLARTPPVEARSPDCCSNVENAPRRRLVTGKPATATSNIRHAILRTPPSPASHRPAAHADAAQTAVRTTSSYREMDASL